LKLLKECSRGPGFLMIQIISGPAAEPYLLEF
jgi:hypothetical protein